MKLLAIIVLGILFAVTLSQAKDLALTDEALMRLHIELNQCEADAKESGIPNYGKCSDIQQSLTSHYSNYDKYQLARKSHQ